MVEKKDGLETKERKMRCLIKEERKKNEKATFFHHFRLRRAARVNSRINNALLVTAFARVRGTDHPAAFDPP